MEKRGALARCRSLSLWQCRSGAYLQIAMIPVLKSYAPNVHTDLLTTSPHRPVHRANGKERADV
jgi:hypothetical protein